MKLKELQVYFGKLQQELDKQYRLMFQDINTIQFTGSPIFDNVTVDEGGTLIVLGEIGLETVIISGELTVPDGVGGDSPGPVDTYPWDSMTDYSSGAEPLGIYNGEKVYKSANTHADGTGGANVNYYIWWRTGTTDRFYITKVVNSVDGARWAAIGTAATPEQDYVPSNGATGTATGVGGTISPGDITLTNGSITADSDLTVGGNTDSATYSVGGVAGASGSGTNITVVNGIVTAIS
jgi:hypothetical protein